MGVPRLFKYIQKNFGRSIINIKHGSLIKRQIDYLYIDANAILHNTTQRVFAYGSNNHLIDDYEHLTYDEKITKVFDTFMQNISQIVTTITPTKILFIAIDGVAPLGKQYLQRSRRFVSGMRSKTEIKDGKVSFDSNCISPGSEFMHNLVQYMNYAIRRDISTKMEWRKFAVIFSPPTVYGEGEHKILNYIRSLPTIEQRESTHCMYGPDGDLIMLTLAANIPNISLLRENQFEEGYSHLLNMGEIARNFEITISDFIFIGFFVGNDFLPKVRMFLYLEDGLDLMLKIYRGSEITEDNIVMFEGLKTFIKRVAQDEYRYIGDQVHKTQYDKRFINTTLLNSINNKGILDIHKYKRAYYSKFLYDPTESAIRGLCKEYIRGLLWVYNYYMFKIPSWNYYYPERYAPLLQDVVLYLDSIDEKEFKELNTFTLGEPLIPFVQLLSILPPTSVNILPPALRPLLSDNSPLSKYLPNVIKIDYEGVTAEHMGVPQIPYIPHDTVKDAYAPFEHIGQSYARNCLGEDSIFFYDNVRTGKFTSPVGNIDMLKARKSFIGDTMMLSFTDKRLSRVFIPNGIMKSISNIKQMCEKIKLTLNSTVPKTISMRNFTFGLDVLIISDLLPEVKIYIYEEDPKKRNLLYYNIYALKLLDKVTITERYMDDVDLCIENNVFD